MRGALVFASAMSLVAKMPIVASVLSEHTVTHRHPKRTAALVTYHKTGTVLAKNVNDNCFDGLGIEFDHEGNLHMPAVHFVRDPKALLRSAFDYHKSSDEVWLHDPDHPRPWLVKDKVVGPTYLPNESYQDYLNRVPFYLGIRAEFLRAAHKELRDMVENAGRCMTHPSICKQVCLEDFTRSSESYRSTWSAILDFLDLDQSYLDCINGYDLLNPNYVGVAEEHATHATEYQSGVVNGEFDKFDEEYTNGTFSKAAASWGCAPLSLRPVSEATHMGQEYRAERYA